MDKSTQQRFEHPTRSAESDGLNEYSGHFGHFTKPDDRLIADILQRRKQIRSALDRRTDSEKPSTKAVDAPSAIHDNPPAIVDPLEEQHFVQHHPDDCAYLRSGLSVCGHCIDICPQEALDVVDQIIRIAHSACVGCGVCSTICPTGAMRSRQPSAQDLLATIQGRIADEGLANPAAAPEVVFHQSATDELSDDAFQGACSHPTLPISVAQIGSIGPEVWLATLAYGADSVTLELPEAYPVKLQAALARQCEWVSAMLAGVAGPPRRIRLAAARPSEEVPNKPAGFDSPPADFQPFQSKRMLIRCSIAHLAGNGATPHADIALPAGAPFGTVDVDRAACTLCMACAGACPTQALNAAGNLPRLKIVESECVQCERCRTVCPEAAITLHPRMLLDFGDSRRPRNLCADEPFACVSCGKGFAPAGLVNKMIRRLDGHWMYNQEKERRRLKMCPDCRVRDFVHDHEQESRP